MGNDYAKAFCPRHQKEKIKYLCSQKKCIEPLCEECLKSHRIEHQKLGFAPNFIPISNLIDQHRQSEKTNAKDFKKQQKIAIQDGKVVPTGYLLKQMTKQYFASRSKKHQDQISTHSVKDRKNYNVQQQKMRGLNNRSWAQGYFYKSSETEYQQLRSNKKLFQIISEYEMGRKMEDSSQVKSRLIQFLKKNLVLNQGVVGKQFSYLYQ